MLIPRTNCNIGRSNDLIDAGLRISLVVKQVCK